MSFGPPVELIIAFFLLISAIVIFLILLIARVFLKKLTFKKIGFVSIMTPIILGFLLLIAKEIDDFIKSPMTVRKYHINGDYVINRELFKGKNADWQYEHYKLKIKKDTLFLTTIEKGVEIKTYKRPIDFIRKGKHTFIEFYNYREINSNIRKELDTYSFDTIVEKYRDDMHPDQTFLRNLINNEIDSVRKVLYDSILEFKIDSAKYYVDHHMLTENPLLHADPFEFNIVLRSTEYGNMFFIKGKWKEIKE